MQSSRSAINPALSDEIEAVTGQDGAVLLYIGWAASASPWSAESWAVMPVPIRPPTCAPRACPASWST